MAVDKTPVERKMTPHQSDLFAVSLSDIEPLLSMTSIGSTAVTFHKYADGKPPTQTMPLSDYIRILWELSVVLQDETIHLSSRHLMPGSTSFIMSNISTCHNLEEALKLIAKSYNVLHGGPYNRVEIKNGYLLYIIDDSQFPYMITNQDYVHFTMECVLVYLHGILSFITSEDMLPLLRKVYTKRKQGPMKSHHMNYWNVPVRYQSTGYTLMYDLMAAKLPITIEQNTMPSSREIYDHVIRMVEDAKPWESRPSNFSNQVLLALDHGIFNQQNIARDLGCSVATLRRRLTLENTTFRQLSRDNLNEKSKAQLSQGFHIADIAEELGFSDLRSFIRAFKNWNGITPAAYSKTFISKK